MRQYYPNAPGWAYLILTLGTALMVVFAVALLRWKKWGFWGIAAVSVVTFFVNMAMGLNLATAFFSSVLGVVILYGVLQIGSENKGWTQLE